MFPNQNDCFNNSLRPRRNSDSSQSEEMTNKNIQRQSQHLFIRRSHNVNLTQGQAQALVDLELSLQAAIEAILIIFDAQEDIDDTELQSLIQELKVIQEQKEIIAIDCSDDITIIQAQIQIEVVVQAVIQLLAKITAKIAET